MTICQSCENFIDYFKIFVCVHHLYNDSSVYKTKKSVYSSMLSYKNKWFEGLKSETVIFVWGVLIIHLKKKKKRLKRSKFGVNIKITYYIPLMFWDLKDHSHKRCCSKILGYINFLIGWDVYVDIVFVVKNASARGLAFWRGYFSAKCILMALLSSSFRCGEGKLYVAI